MIHAEFPYEEIKQTILSDSFLPADRFRIVLKNSDSRANEISISI